MAKMQLIRSRFKNCHFYVSPHSYGLVIRPHVGFLTTGVIVMGNCLSIVQYKTVPENLMYLVYFTHSVLTAIL